MSGLSTVARVVHVILLALGIGAAAQLLMLSDVLGGAGGNVQTLARANLDGFMLLSAPVLLVTLGLGWLPLQAPMRYRVAGVIAWTALAGVSGRYIAPQMDAARAALGRSLEGLPATAPGFDDWSQMTSVSEILLVAQLVVGVVLLLLSVAAGGPKRSFSGIQL